MWALFSGSRNFPRGILGGVRRRRSLPRRCSTALVFYSTRNFQLHRIFFHVKTFCISKVKILLIPITKGYQKVMILLLGMAWETLMQITCLLDFAFKFFEVEIFVNALFIWTFFVLYGWSWQCGGITNPISWHGMKEIIQKIINGIANFSSIFASKRLLTQLLTLSHAYAN